MWARGLFSADELEALATAYDLAGAPGARLKLTTALQRYVGADSKLGQIIQQILPAAQARRLVAFDKSLDQNWGLPWHQDRVIAVAEKHDDVPGFETWSRKAGVWHCEPPIELLDQMVFARIHIDPADQSNGALQLAAGTHKLGLIAEYDARRAAEANRPEICLAEPGDVLIVKALTLHRSAASQIRRPRRALRIDYSNVTLTPPLAWAF